MFSRIGYYINICLFAILGKEDAFLLHMKPKYHDAIISLIHYYKWKDFIYLYDSSQGNIYIYIYIYIDTSIYYIFYLLLLDRYVKTKEDNNGTEEF